MLKYINYYISTLWLQGTFYNFYPFEIQFFSIVFFFLFFWLKYSWFTEKAMASHSSTLAWKIPWTKEPDRLQSMGSLRVGHDWATSILLFTFLHWNHLTTHRSGKSLTCFLSLSICLFCTLHINRLIQYVIFLSLTSFNQHIFSVVIHILVVYSFL